MVRACELHVPCGDPGAQSVRHKDSSPVPASSLTSRVTGVPGAVLVSCLAPPRADLAVQQEGQKGIASQEDASHIHMVYRSREEVWSNTLS